MFPSLRPALPWMLLSTLGALCMAAGCQGDEPFGVVEPPLVVRDTYPDDASFVGTGDDSFALDLDVVFRRATEPTDVRFALYPAPLRAGDITRSSTGRTWTWRDVWLTGTAGCYYWIIDGLEMRRPVVVRLVTGNPRISAAGFAGVLTSSNPVTMPVDGALIFALDALSEFNPLQPETFADVVPLAVAEVDSLGDPGERDYHTRYLELFRSYTVVAILDTSGDACYDPAVDAWGYHVDSGGGFEAVVASIPVPGGTGDSGYRVDVDLTIYPADVAKQRARQALSPR